MLKENDSHGLAVESKRESRGGWEDIERVPEIQMCREI